MRRDDFESLVRHFLEEVPDSFLEGVAEVTVSPRVVAHPERAGVFTLGECIPLPPSEASQAGETQSRIVLYHGSFAAMAEGEPGFAWREEAWETLMHELRHHLEWRARTPELEAFDEAAEHNFARQEGEPFDPLFYLDGTRAGDGVFRIDDDVFLDILVRRLPAEVDFEWERVSYRVRLPAEARLPALLIVEGVASPPPGDLVLAIRRQASLLDLLRRATVFQGRVTAESRLR
jgi:predicted Zn-dependent protease with MMP-like domain